MGSDVFLLLFGIAKRRFRSQDAGGHHQEKYGDEESARHKGISIETTMFSAR
jgi:hypothetical protein